MHVNGSKGISLSSRNGHMITHRDKKPYECNFPDCDKSYSDMRSLKRHLENHHGVPPVSSSSSYHSTVGHSNQYLTVPRASNLLHPNGPEDRNNNMKGAVQPERPSSAPSATPEVRTRSRIRSNSCEDLPSQTDREAVTDNEASKDSKDDFDDDAFMSSEPKKKEAFTPASDRLELSAKQSETNAQYNNISTNPERNNISSPRNSKLHQWPGGQFPGANLPASWGSNPAHWNNAQLVASMAMAQSHANLPLMMGYRQPYQQLYPAGYYPGSSNDVAQMEPTIKKPKQEMIASSQNAFAQNALQMFASMAAQRTPMPTDMLINQGTMGCYADGQSAANNSTNPAAIAIAAAKAGSMFCVPHDMRLYGAHPGATQWQDVSNALLIHIF